jgi:hypothetical protein
MHIFIDNFGKVIKDDKYRQVKEETGLTDKELSNLIKKGAIIEGSKVNLELEEIVIIGKIYG